MMFMYKKEKTFGGKEGWIPKECAPPCPACLARPIVQSSPVQSNPINQISRRGYRTQKVVSLDASSHPEP